MKTQCTKAKRSSVKISSADLFAFIQIMCIQIVAVAFHFNKCRSSHLEVFCKKGVLENSKKITGKHLCQSLFLNKVAGPATSLKKTLAKARPSA